MPAHQATPPPPQSSPPPPFPFSTLRPVACGQPSALKCNKSETHRQQEASRLAQFSHRAFEGSPYPSRAHLLSIAVQNTQGAPRLDVICTVTL